jgi:two-component system LytT family sensor kinase
VDLNSPAFYLYSDVKANTHITTILPIALAVLLPGLSIYANPGYGFPEGKSFLIVWAGSSIILYVLWQLLWKIWDLPSKYRILGFLGSMLAYVGIMMGGFSLIGFESAAETPGVGAVRIMLATVLFIAIQFALKAQQHVSKLSLEKEQIQTENYKVQLKALRAKIDPHFLFNSLNTLRSMVRQRHEQCRKICHEPVRLLPSDAATQRKHHPCHFR